MMKYAIAICLSFGSVANAIDIYGQSGVRTGVIFETDFSSDTGYSASNNSLWQTGVGDMPTGFDGVKCTGSCAMDVVAEGVGGSNCIKFTYDTASQPTMSLGKHLSGNSHTGFDELYIRYRVKFDDDFKAGDGDGSIPYWKWGRLWQNTGTTNDGTWTENRKDSFYIVWNFGNGDASIRQTNMGITWCANTSDLFHSGSSGGGRWRARFDTSGVLTPLKDGHFENMGAGDWQLDWTNKPAEPAGRFVNTPQDWHTIEWHFKLASDNTSDDGVFEVWFDGVDQGPTDDHVEQGDAIGQGITGPPTARHKSGFNWITCFDNMVSWNEHWGDVGVDGAIRVNDVVVSHDRIGHTYNVGD